MWILMSTATSSWITMPRDDSCAWTSWTVRSMNFNAQHQSSDTFERVDHAQCLDVTTRSRESVVDMMAPSPYDEGLGVGDAGRDGERAAGSISAR